jgi:HK97 family phage major capsid protein
MKYADTLRTAVTALEAERVALKAEAEAIDTAPADEKRTADEIKADADKTEARVGEILDRNSAIVAEIAAKQARIAELDALDAARAAAPTFIKPAEPVQVADVRNMNVRQMADVIARASEERDIDPTHALKIFKRHAPKDRAWAMNLAARTSEAYQSGWVKLMTGRDWDLTAEERTAMSVGSNTNGGFLLPTHLDPTIMLTNSGSSNAIRAISRVVTLTDGASSWNGITSAGVTASWDAELTEVSDDTPADYARPNVPVYQAKAFARASFEAFEDIDGLAADVLMMFGDARDVLEGAAHATGTGSGQPTGIFTALDANTNVEVMSTTAATIGVVDLQGIKRSVPVRWRKNGTYVMAPVYGDAIKLLGTAVSSAYSTNLTEANTEKLLGRPVVETDDAPTTQTTTVRDNEVVYGDFSNYLIVDKPGGMSVEFVPQLFSTTTNLPDGSRGWLAHWRSGADSVNDVAFRLLQDKTSA